MVRVGFVTGRVNGEFFDRVTSDGVIGWGLVSCSISTRRAGLQVWVGVCVILSNFAGRFQDVCFNYNEEMVGAISQQGALRRADSFSESSLAIVHLVSWSRVKWTSSVCTMDIYMDA